MRRSVDLLKNNFSANPPMTYLRVLGDSFSKGLRKNKLTFPMTIVSKGFSRSVLGWI